jgi:WD repeat-containing protein 35
VRLSTVVNASNGLQNVQRAEVAVYFKRFDEAEQLYFKMDRPDLAVDMRMRLGE